MSLSRVHGGPDSAGAPPFDFSTNSNACGPCPQALLAIGQADATSYPDASYARLRAQLAAFHAVDATRIVLAGSASEFIFRVTAAVAQQAHASGRGPATVSLPLHSYGDYSQAAAAWGLLMAASPDSADLVWACEPSSPLGLRHAEWPQSVIGAERPRPEVVVVLDRAYEPLRLGGTPSLSPDSLTRMWQLWTPNKALGLTGVRAAYVIAPLGTQATVDALEAMAPSWPVGAHGVALLHAWVQPEVQHWLANSLRTLSEWKIAQIALLQDLGWTCLPSEANFFCAQPAQVLDVSGLREAGIKLRDATSFGLPGYFRLSVQGPEVQAVLKACLRGAVG